MKRTALVVMLAVTLCAPLVKAQESSAPPSAPKTSSADAGLQANAQKGRALLDKMIAALGGQAYLGYKTRADVGRSYGFYKGEPNSTGTPFWRFFKYPDKDRIELTKQRDVTQIVVGDKGYEKTFKGVAAMEPEPLDDFLRRRAHSLDVVLREWLKDPATQIFFDGTGLADQKMVNNVTLLSKDNDSVTISIDQITSLPIKRTFSYRDPVDKLKNVEEETYANFRSVQGIMTAHTISRSHNDMMTNQRFLSEVQYNVEVPDAQFEATVTFDPYKRSGPRHLTWLKSHL
jgi:hypothetical protein